MKKEIHTLNVLNRIPSIQEKDVKALELKKAIAEMEHDWTITLYRYVPIETIQAVIEKHGGINVEETFKVAES